MSKKSLILSIDFDGTVVKHAFPEIGEEQPGAFETLRLLQAAGHRLCLNTCREDERRPYLTEAVEYCRKNGVEFRSVNENHEDDEFRDKVGRKMYAHVYIDDRNFGGFPGWDVIRKTLLAD